MGIRTRMGKGGRVVVPVKLRRALDIQPGDEIILRLGNGQIRLIPLRQAIDLAQKTVQQYVPEGTSLVDALIQERREEARRE